MSVQTSALQLNGSTSQSCTLQATATAGNVTFTWPANTGSNGQLLTTNGSGVMSWTSAPATGVTSITPGNGLTSSPNPITATGTISVLANGSTISVTASGIAIANSVALPGNPTTTTQPLATNNTTIATTAFVLANSGAGANAKMKKYIRFDSTATIQNSFGITSITKNSNGRFTLSFSSDPMPDTDYWMTQCGGTGATTGTNLMSAPTTTGFNVGTYGGGNSGANNALAVLVIWDN